MSDEEFWATVHRSRPAAQHDPVPHALLERIVAGDHMTAGPTASKRRRWLSAGPVTAATGVGVALVVALAVLVGHHRSGSLSSGSSVAKIVAQAPDPAGGLPWGLRTVRTTRGQICLDVGRLQNGTLGTVGIDGAWGNDHRFHAMTSGSAHAGPGRSCWVTDVRGDAFLNVTSRNTIANAATEGEYNGSARGNARATLLCPSFSRTGVGPPSQAKPCPPGALRDLAYGVLGPEATSISYIGQDGQRVTEPTHGPDGAYLIVARHPTTTCTASTHTHRLSCPSGGSYGPELSAGIITKVTYRNGRVCRLPAPNAAGLVPQVTCPLVGLSRTGFDGDVVCRFPSFLSQCFL